MARRVRQDDTARREGAVDDRDDIRRVDEPADAGQRGAGDENADHGADKPREISKGGWMAVLKRTAGQIQEDNVILTGAGVAFYFFLALFPTLIAAVTIYALVMDPNQIQNQIQDLAANLPQGAGELVTQQITDAATGAQGGLTVGLIVSLAAVLWAASGGMNGLIKGINIAYDETDDRNFFVRRGLAILLTVGGILFFAAAVALVAVIPALLGNLGLGDIAATVVNWLRWPVLALMLVVALAVVYRVAPNRENPRFQWVSWGAVAATVLWLVGSALFSFYVSNWGNYNETYGALAGVIVLMLWLFLTAVVVLLGAELNSEMEHQTARDTTTGEPEPMGQRDAVKADTVAGGGRS